MGQAKRRDTYEERKRLAQQQTSTKPQLPVRKPTRQEVYNTAMYQLFTQLLATDTKDLYRKGNRLGR